MLTKRPILTGTIAAATAIAIFRFVDFGGSQAAAQGQKVRGVACYAANIGDQVAIDELGTTTVEAGAAIAVGQDVITDNQGRAIPAAALAIAAGAVAVTSAAANGAADIAGSVPAEYRVGKALSAAAAAGDFIELLFAR